MLCIELGYTRQGLSIVPLPIQCMTFKGPECKEALQLRTAMYALHDVMPRTGVPTTAWITCAFFRKPVPMHVVV